MILRTYRAQVRRDALAAYEAFERDEGVPMVLSMTGCRGAGFGRVQEATGDTYLFVSMWESAADLQAARASEVWRRVAGRLAQLGFTVGEDLAEHVDLRVWRSPDGAGKR